MDYDVVIIGAGPAGLNCAYNLENSGLKVLIVEKNKIIGKKVCAGGLLNHDLKYLKLPEKIIERKFKSVNVYSNLQKAVADRGKYYVYTVDRVKLGQWMVGRLRNADIIKNTEVMEISKKYIIAGNKKYYYKYLIGADGSNSMVRKYLGLKTEKYMVAMHYVVKGSFPDMELYFDNKLFKTGYVWIFPHKGYASIGCGSSQIKTSLLKKNFDFWLKKHNIDVSKSEFQAHTLNFDYRGHSFNNIFLIGDAAGLVSDATGEGIYQAMVSGEQIANEIMKKPTIDYISKIIDKKNTHAKLMHFSEKLGFLRPLFFEFAVSMAKSSKQIEKYAYLNRYD